MIGIAAILIGLGVFAYGLGNLVQQAYYAIDAERSYRKYNRK